MGKSRSFILRLKKKFIKRGSSLYIIKLMQVFACGKNLVSLAESESPLAPLTRAYIAFFGKFIESLGAISSGTPLRLAPFL